MPSDDVRDMPDRYPLGYPAPASRSRKQLARAVADQDERQNIETIDGGVGDDSGTAILRTSGHQSPDAWPRPRSRMAPSRCSSPSSCQRSRARKSPAFHRRAFTRLCPKACLASALLVLIESVSREIVVRPLPEPSR